MVDDINNSELTQKEIDYLVEFVENGNSKNWEKAKKDLHSDMHRDSIRKSWYVGKYSGYSVYKYMQDKMEKEYDKNYRRNWWLMSNEIIKLGIADKIVTKIEDLF